jgi:uncharacterized delta-60 repeat protein
LFLLFSPSAHAEGGDLDVTFDGDGRVMTDLGAGDDASAVAVQPDGKIIAAGSSYDPDLAFLVRYESTGALDTTFGGDGIVDTVPLVPADVAVQDDGKIVVAGNGSVARFSPDGTLDTSFGGDGIASVPRFFLSVSGVAIQPDGKIVLVGNSFTEGEAGIAGIIRFNHDGTVDRSFARRGMRKLGRYDGRARAVAIQPNGKIVVVGSDFTDRRPGHSHHVFALFRLRANGANDTSFGHNGRVRTGWREDDTDAWDVALQDDGKIVAAGNSSEWPDTDFALARYTRGGRLDTTFSDDGKKRTNFTGGIDEAHGLVIQANGRIVVAGFAAPPGHHSQQNFAVARYWRNGELDHNFSDDGKARTRFGARDYDHGNDVALQLNGRIVVAGSTTLREGAYDIGLARYLAR